jgi:hypothetical protein
MLNFRNIDASPADPVEKWGFEGILAVIERGGLSEWSKLYKAVQKDPFGKVAQELEEAISATEGGHLGEGIAGLFEMGLKELRSAQ